MNEPQSVVPHDDARARAAEPPRAPEPPVDPATPSRAPRWPLLRRALPLAALAALAALLLATGLADELRWERLVAHHATIREWQLTHPTWTLLALLGALLVLMASGLPGSLGLAVFAGVLYGTLGGALVATLGSTLGAAVLYAAARRFFVGQRAPPPLLAGLRAGYLRHPVSFTFFIRLFPAFPMGALSVALAWLGCPWWLFVAASATGAFVHGLVWCGLGAGMAHVLTHHAQPDLAAARDLRVLLPLAGLAALALLPVLLRRWQRTLA